jgi:ABC-2 type transport system permease protein
MRLAWAFFKRDATIAMSYRAAFLVQLVGMLLVLGVFYYIGRTLGDRDVPALKDYGGSFLAFLLIGIALTDCVGVSLTTFAAQVREGQLTGTLEAVLMSPVRLPIILLLSSLWAYCFSGVRFLLYLVLGALLYGVDLGRADALSAIVIFLMTVLCFAGIGMVWASVVMLVKRGESIMTVAGYLVVLVSGVLFPTESLPGWLQQLAALIPLKPALDGMRFALLQGAAPGDLAAILVKLALFSAILLGLGFVAFDQAVKYAKRTGSLTEF